MHAHDRHERQVTKHQGSKGKATMPPFRKGQRVYHKTGLHKGTVINIDSRSGAFTIKWDEQMTGRLRRITYHSTQAHGFETGNPPEVTT